MSVLPRSVEPCPRSEALTAAEDDDCAWVEVCHLESIEPGRGVRALVGGYAVALFRVDDGADATVGRVWAIGDIDPCTGVSVLSRGLLGSRSVTGGIELYVASPLRKHRFALHDGSCLDEPSSGAGAWAVRVRDGRVRVSREPVVAPSCRQRRPTQGT
ncbi:nitrite reductase small subunit NirD [Rhabdothermincola sp.]|uniref:nitrite reductase small subunit NirD n=1 Tax=Rhabdothermincola sp. TaxID=2820405 RepID=UPI002FE181FB